MLYVGNVKTLHGSKSARNKIVGFCLCAKLLMIVKTTCLGHAIELNNVLI